MEALVTPVLGTAVPSLVKLLKYEWALDKTVKEGLISLEAELRSMQALLEDVSSVPADELDRQMKLWAGEVRELSYAMETRLHSYMVRIESTKGTILSAMSKRVINHDIAGYIKEAKIKTREVSERRQRYSRSSSKSTSSHKLDPRIFALPTKESDLVGLAGATDELTKMLSEGNHVSIFGMGGLGKTTLARAVYDRIIVGFDCGAVVSVGRNPDKKKVLKDILYELHTEIYGDAPNELQLIHQLRKSLVGKRCLIFIDDIWDKETWALINSAFATTTDSRIITTTRKLEVAEAIGVVYVIKPLSHANSQELLNTKIFGANTESHDTKFAILSDKILWKCGGVPIAIITIARLLSKKPREEWSKVYNSIDFGEHGKEDVVKDIRVILSFSYYDLPYHLQRCFLYIGLFPDGHWIEKNMLIWRWVAEGLVPSCNEQAVGSFQLGETYFDELIDRSMIQRAVSPRDLGQGGCRVHDMILDLIRGLSSSENENFSTIIGTKKEASTSQTRPTIHRLAIHKKTVDEIPNTGPPSKKHPNTGLEVGEVLSFYASTCASSCLPPLSRFSRLRVIDLEECDLSVGDCKLKHIGKLDELGYVGLLGTPIAKFPKEIRRLKFLQTLDVTGTGIKELPPLVSELKQLRCMRAGKGTSMMGRVGELASLEELWLHSADKSPDFVVELRKLRKIRVLIIHLDEMQEKLVESLYELENLEILQVWCDAEEKVRLPCWEENAPFPKLRQLLLFGVIQSRLMPWIHYSCVPELTKLLLEVEVLEAQDLEILGQMPSLQSLYLHSSEVVNRCLSYTPGKDEFKVLEYLNTNIELVCGQGALPKIQELEVAGIKVGTDAGLQGNMPLLERATYHLDCIGCHPVEIEKAEAALRQASQAHPNRPTISIKRFHDFPIAKIKTEVEHHLLETVTGELRSTLQLMISDNLRRLGGGGGDEAQANANSEASSIGFLSSFYDMSSETISRILPSIIARPTLALGDATADDTSSPSQFAGGVPPRRPTGEGHVLLTSHQLAKGQLQLSTDGMLTVLSTQPAADLVSSMATQIGVDPVVLTDLLQKFARNPECIAAINNIQFDANGSFSSADISAIYQLVMPEIIEQQEHKTMKRSTWRMDPRKVTTTRIISHRQHCL